MTRGFVIGLIVGLALASFGVLQAQQILVDIAGGYDPSGVIRAIHVDRQGFVICAEPSK